MSWWGWLLVAWAALASAAGVVLGAVAANARARKRIDRANRYRLDERGGEEGDGS